MHSRKDHHRRLIGIITGDLLIDIEKVSVFGFDCLFTISLDRVGKIQEDRQAGPHALAFIAGILGISRGYVSGNEVSEGRIFSLQEIVSFRLRNTDSILCL